MDIEQEHQVLVVTTTAPSVEEARRMAQLILASRLASCVQVDAGITSFYRWEGRDCETPEWRLVIKTVAGCAGPLQRLLAQHHPYDTPLFVATVAAASAAYAAWVRSEVDVPAPAAPDGAAQPSSA
jgi:periplasmic divalent cation tolerance protein